MPLFYLLSVYLRLNKTVVFTVLLLLLAVAFISPLKVRKLKLPGIILAGLLVIAEAGLMIRMVF